LQEAKDPSGIYLAGDEILYGAEDLESATSYVAAIPRRGGVARRIASGLAPVVSLAADASTVYLATAGYEETEARSGETRRVGSTVATCSGGETRILAQDNRALRDLLRAGDSLYWTAGARKAVIGGAIEKANGAVMRARVDDARH
jgi:hypothetical protein